MHARNAHSIILLFVMHVRKYMDKSNLARTVHGSFRRMHMRSPSRDVDEYLALFRLVWREEVIADDQVAFKVDFEAGEEVVELGGQSGRVRSYAGTEDEDVGLADLGADKRKGGSDVFGFSDGCGVGVDCRCRVVFLDGGFRLGNGGCVPRKDGDVGGTGGSEGIGDG